MTDDTNTGTKSLQKPSLSAKQKAVLTPRQRETDPGAPISIRHLRNRQRLTQKQVAEQMGTEQDRVSRLERRADMRVSTLRDYVAALGGSLRLVADIPGQEPVTIRLPQRETPARKPPRRREQPTR
jgi:DNA-binding transcriptional regulator YiaG